MKRVYSTLRPPIDQKSYADWITKCDQNLSVSSRGLVAFTSSFCLNQSRPNSISYHVYVADINTPYQPYLIADSENQFSIIEWDLSGTKLLVCDVRGCVTIFSSKDYLISDWKPYFKQVFAAEQFITASWYHSGIVTSINVANQNLKTSSNHLEYTDKIQQTKFGASLRLFGGKAADGCILISKTGLVCCLTLLADGSVDVTTESLNPLRIRIEVADISHHKDGAFIVGTSNGSINATIAFYRVALSSKSITLDEVDTFTESKRVNIQCKQYNSFHLNVMSQILNERENTCVFERVNHIRFVSKDTPSEVLIEVGGQNLSLVELWKLKPRKKMPVHSAILELKQNSTTNPDNPQAGKPEENGAAQQSNDQSKEWVFEGNHTDPDKCEEVVTIHSSKFKLFGPNTQHNFFLLAYKDSTISYVRKEKMERIFTLDLSIDSSSPAPRNGRFTGMDIDSKSPYKMYQNRGPIRPSAKNSPASKRFAKTNYITDIQLSANQKTFIAIDAMSQLHVVELPPLLTCEDEEDEQTYLQYILEYCLITGNDWWDVLVSTRQQLIEKLCDKFHDAFERQPRHMQRTYSNKQLMIRASLFRCLNVASSLCKSADCHTMIMLSSIASTLKSMLRSHQEQDSPAEQLSNFLKAHGNQPQYFNCNNVMTKLNSKDFLVEPNLIQCFQPIHQWVTEFAIFLIASQPNIPDSKMNGNGHKPLLPGAGLARNKEALEILRELLIIIRLWALQNEASLPIIYKLNDQIDILGTLFRLISICYASLLGIEPEPSFQEECLQFTNTISISQFAFVLPACGVASPLLHGRGVSGDEAHLTLEYFQQPPFPELAHLDKVECGINMTGNRKIDVVRHVSLGAYPVTNVRHCTRCNSVSLIRPSFNTNRIWEQRWMSNCVCGGCWAQSDRISPSKVSHLATLHQATTIGSHLTNQLIR